MFRSTTILISSPNPDKLMNFYKDVLKLELCNQTTIEERSNRDTPQYEFQLTPEVKLLIEEHVETYSQNNNPIRIIHDLHTNDVQGWYTNVRDAECKIISPPTKIFFNSKDFPLYICIFLDPDGNAWRFIGTLHSAIA